MNKLFKSIFTLETRLSKYSVIVVFAILIVLNQQGFLAPVIAMLQSNDLTFKIGDLKFTLYMVVKSIILIIVLFWCIGLISSAGEKYFRNLKNIKPSNRNLITKAFQIVVYFLGGLVALDLLGIDLTALTVLSGAIGIGIGFGLQKITSNFISGIILLFEKSIEEGDLVELDDGIYGYIKRTSARYTLVETTDGKEVLIPNEDFITSRVTNWTFSNTQGRISIPIGVSYKSDIELAHQLILEAANEHERCSNDPAPECYLREYGDSSVNFILFFWVDDIIKGRYAPQSEVMFAIWRKFRANDIEIPFPQRDVHIKHAEGLE